MYLKSLSIVGFKSFAKKSELEFSSPITAIVGPNGSGKSNVAESCRFVLGEQSVKSLRGKRGEDLIWGGTEQVARGNRAQVVVVFDNVRRTFALDFDEVKIERTVHRDGQNEYKINDSVVRLKDVLELLGAAHIGSTGHHIISQGEADRVLSAGGKERREMIEDALGLKVYQVKKQEAERKLEKTLENIAQVESLRRESAPHIKYLQKQVERAEQARSLQDQLKVVYADYLKREDVYIAHHHDRLITARRDPAEELTQIQHTLLHAKRTLTTQSEVPQTKSFEATASRVAEAGAARAAALQAVGKLEGQTDLLNRRIESAARAASRADTATIARHTLKKLVDGIVASAEKALTHGSEERIARALADIVHQLKVFIERTDTVPVTNDDEKELRSLAALLESAQHTLAEATTAESEAQAAFVAEQARVVAQKDASHEAERTVYELIGKQREIESQLATIDRELAVLERDRDEFKRELQEAVALLGRGASMYFEYEVVDETNAVVAIDALLTEDRTLQRSRQRELEKLKIRLEELGLGATDELVKEYQAAVDRDAFLVHEISDLETSLATLRTLIDELEVKISDEFSVGIDKISLEFNNFFTLMFGGGSASLEPQTLSKRRVEEGEDTTEVPTEIGIEISIKLPNKRVSGLDMLSGGERALTSIALIFAMSQVNPPPFIILDETDAALDEANSRRYGDMIEALAKKSQLILITHNRETMSRAGILYGVTMGLDGVSKLLSVRFDEAAVVAK